jgi:glycosyltransferase involved in cell wall biosynthesis
LIDRVDVQFIGKINEQNKNAFLGEAVGPLFPIDWPEPFGLVMIEGGTPVLALRSGSVPEIVDEGVSGMIVETMEEAIAAVPRLLTANEYVHLYRRRWIAEPFASNSNFDFHPRAWMLHRIAADKSETEITESPAFNIVENEAIN